jgi:hypothetical protein
MKQGLRAALTCLAVCAAGGCRPRTPAPTAGAKPREPGPLESGLAYGGLAVRALLDKQEYASNDAIVVEVTLCNEGQSPVLVRKVIGPYAELALDLRDAAGKKVRSRQIRWQLARSRDPRDFVQFDPGYLYGLRIRLVPKHKLMRPTYYALVYPPAAEVDQRFFLPGAGDYSLTVRYSGADSGSAAGLRGWTGTIESNTVRFRILP